MQSRYRIALFVVLYSAVTFPLCGAAQTATGAESRVPRVGIISDANSRSEADLLMIELQKARCELVERDEINKVIGEQTLQLSMNRAESLRVGQILKADGLILMSSGANNTMSVRFVAVAPGVVVWFADFEAKKDKNAPTLSTVLAPVLTGLLPKLEVKKSDALPVSMFRVRPAFGTPQCVQLADDMTRLLQLRLVREPSLFVLERENLRRMEEEQRWAGKETDFWTGSYLVEGSIHYDVVQTNLVTLTLAVRPPTDIDKKRTGTVSVEEKGSTTNLVQLVERVTGRLCGVFGARTAGTAWDAAQEGRQLVALAKRLPDLRQKRTALESAMALGNHDLATGSMYRDVLRTIAQHGNELFNSLAKGASRVQQAQDVLAYLRFVNTFQPTGGFTPDTEKKFLFCYFPPLYDGCFYLCVVAENDADGELREVVPDIQKECLVMAERMQRFQSTLGIYGSVKGGGLPGCFAEYAPFLHSRMGEVLAIYRKAGLGFHTREQIEPAFPTAATESRAERDALWREYQREMEGSADVNIRYALWRNKNAKVLGGDGVPFAGKPAERSKFQEDVLAHPEFSPMIARDSFCLNASLFPRYSFRNGSYWRGGQPIPISEVKGNAKYARLWLLALMKMAPARLDEWPLNKPIASWDIAFPYTEFYTESEAKELCEAIRQRDAQLANTNKTDLTYLIDALTARFPAIADSQQKDRQAKVADEGSAAERFRRNAVQVTREYLNLAAGRGNNFIDPFTICGYQTNQVWFTWGGDIGCLNLATKEYALWPVPAPAEPTIRTEPRSEFCVVTESYIVYCIHHRFTLSFARDYGSTLALCRRGEKQWRSQKLPFNVGAMIELGGRLYAIVSVPTTTEHSDTGIVIVDPATFKCELLVDPASSVARPDLKSDVAVLSRANGQTRIAGAGNELLVWYDSRYCCAWNPETKTVRKASQEEWKTATEEHDMNTYRFASRKWGFELIKGQGWNTNSPKYVTESGAYPVGAKCLDSGEVCVIPLVVNEEPRFSVENNKANGNWKGISGPFLSTSTSIIIPFDNMSRHRGFWDIPYADIQQWLAANLTRTNAPAGRIETGGLSRESGPK